jgi:nitrogen fixation protein NifB
MAMLDRIMAARGDDIGMVAITGPGDPLATPDITLDTIDLVRRRYPLLKIGLRTMGIGSARLAADLARSGLVYVEMQVDGVRADILEKVYAWIRPAAKTLKIGEAVTLLLQEQRHGVPALKFHDITVAILTTLYPGHNTDHVARIAAEMMELGADCISLLPYAAETGAEVDLEVPSTEVIAGAAAKAAVHLRVVEPVLALPAKASMAGIAANGPTGAKPSRQRPCIAVASKSGIEVDLHLGQAATFLIYGPREDGLVSLLEARVAPQPGEGSKRWQSVAATLSDCCLLLVADAGETPRRVLAEAGLTVLITEDNIEGLVDSLYGGGKKGRKKK